MDSHFPWIPIEFFFHEPTLISLRPTLSCSKLDALKLKCRVRQRTYAFVARVNRIDFNYSQLLHAVIRWRFSTVIVLIAYLRREKKGVLCIMILTPSVISSALYFGPFRLHPSQVFYESALCRGWDEIIASTRANASRQYHYGHHRIIKFRFLQRFSLHV